MLQRVGIRAWLSSLLLAVGACTTVEQATECEEYIACLVETDPASVGEAIEHYGPDGSCWDEADPSPQQCATACKNGRYLLAVAFPDADACQ